VDGIFHVCRAFEDPDVTHVEDRIDPVGDLEIIHSELRLKDIERLTSEGVWCQVVVYNFGDLGGC
jgi:obg-like ATPase 1